MAEKKHRISLEKVLSYSAILAAIAAVFVAVYEARINREFQELSVQPYVSIIGNVAFGEEALLSLRLSNNGLGPARLMETRILLDKQPMSNWQQAIAAATSPSLDLDLLIQNGGGSHSMRPTGYILPAGESFAPFQVLDQAATQQLVEADILNRLTVEQRYCSLFGKCWLTRYPDGSTEPAAPLPTP